MFRDAWAQELWGARREVRVVREPASVELELDRALAIADELYAALAEVSPLVGWKLGATDPRTQASFGTDRPFTAPIYGDGIIANGDAISLSRFVAPRLEAEIGLRVHVDGIQLVPCVEIVDCRFPGWKLTLPGAIADFGLQGAFIFGQGMAGDPAEVSEIEVTVKRDGIEMQRGSANPADAVARLRYLSQELHQDGHSSHLVATGSLISPISLDSGHWVADFGAFGSLSLRVVN